MTLPPPTLLNDDQMSRFIVDGYLILTSDVPPEVHQRIDERLVGLLHGEANPGNNILPAVPEMHAVLNCSVVRGALQSVLGTDYILHPHRFVHNNEPGSIDEGKPKVGLGSHTFVGWHQDSHSPLARPRHHFCHYAMVLYYPQDTPIEMGPTQLIPGTHMFKSYNESDILRGIPAAGPAGTCVLVHFDIVHGGSLNTSTRTRNMAKFVFARCSEPTAIPSWASSRDEWIAPQVVDTPWSFGPVWRRHWDWYHGRRRMVIPTDSYATRDTSGNAETLEELRDALRATDVQAQLATIQRIGEHGGTDAARLLTEQFARGEPFRSAAIYAFSNTDTDTISFLVDRLAGLQRGIESGEIQDGWNEMAVVMEDDAYAVAAIGKPAVTPLVRLLNACESDSNSTWLRINVAFALGEMGEDAAEAMPELISLLKDRSHAVVRTALDAIGQVRVGSHAALPEIRRLMLDDNFPESWHIPLFRQWTGLNQVRTNAVLTLLRMDNEAAHAEEWLGQALDDKCGYIGGFGVEFMLRTGNVCAYRAAIEYLSRHRWDSTLEIGKRTF